MGALAMGAAALTGSLPLRRHGAASRAVDQSLAVHATGGPVVAVCGLVGGAGTSTLAYLLARQAARHSTVPVLLAELGEQGALAAMAGSGGAYGLAGLATAVQQQQTIAAPFTELSGGLRLVARARPALEAPVSTAGLGRVLGDAHDAHGLVVVDAGLATAPAAAALLEEASHVLFTLPATVAALERAELLARTGIFNLVAGQATLVAVATRPGRGASVKRLRRLAASHTERLLLVPHIRELADGEPARADARLQDTFLALATLLRRPR